MRIYNKSNMSITIEGVNISPRHYKDIEIKDFDKLNYLKLKDLLLVLPTQNNESKTEKVEETKKSTKKSAKKTQKSTINNIDTDLDKSDTILEENNNLGDEN